MANLSRSGVLLLGLTLLVMLLGGPPLAAPRATAAGTESFTQTVPLKVYAGVPSHFAGDPPVALAADADPTAGTTGYCVTVVNEGHVSVGPNLGFSVTNGTILSTSYFNNGSATTTDDVYCVVVVADIPAEFAGRTYLNTPPMTIAWSYLDSGQTLTTSLEVAVVYVRLVGRDAGPAQVCTVGWDPTFLTGRASMTPPTIPNPVDEVVVGDWTTVPGGPTISVAGTLRASDGIEWCANLFGNGPGTVTGVQVTLHFVAVYDRNSVNDDVSLTATTTMDVTTPPAPELRHVNGEGQIVLDQEAAPNVIGARHTACIVPSDTNDTLPDPTSVNITSPDGANVTGLRVYYNPASPSPDHLAGVPNGTVCFDWYSTTEGFQQVSVIQFVRGGTNPTGSGPVSVKWDSNDADHGNNFGDLFEGGLLLKSWNRVDRTVISTTGSPDEGEVTNGEVTLATVFNAANGTFLGQVGLTEFVIGSRPGPDGTRISSPLDGVPVVLTIAGQCGYFTKPGPGVPGTRTVTALTVSGRVAFQVAVDQDPGCNSGSVIQVRIQAYYPETVGGAPAAAVETVSIALQFGVAQAQPILAWAGQTVTITYGFSGNCPEQTAVFLRAAGQPGTFLSSFGARLNGPDSAETSFTNCTSVVQYESEDPGEVDISAQLRGNVFSEEHFFIIFMAFEDLALTGPDHLNVSEIGQLDAQVRGWFTNANPSGRKAETKPDGRVVPKDRWVLPDDWLALRGPEGFRIWPDQAPMPPARVTFLMEDEGVRNSFATGVKNGALGFFLPDDGAEFAYNVHPDSGQPSVLGESPDPTLPPIFLAANVAFGKPRIISEFTDLDGVAEIEQVGDLNLSFEGCAANAPTGNPDCRPGDVVGHTRYYAVADYTQACRHDLVPPCVEDVSVPRTARGKFPAVRSNTIPTEFTWAGYKQVTVVDGPARSMKYVVAHLKDRDGFCDAIFQNNVLGIPVDFMIDAGDGIIVDAADDPILISQLARFARTTTFDTVDDLGNPINVTVTQPTVESDECQAWIRISNSLPTTTNVKVLFPAQPSPVPANVRITGFVCGPAGAVTITNLDDHLVSLAGFSLHSLNPNGLPEPEEYLGLQGHLAPGESVTIPADLSANPWLNATGVIFGNVTGDYASLVWNRAIISVMFCDGGSFNPPLPVFAPEGEGPIELDVVLSFAGPIRDFSLVRGWNLVTGGSAPADVAEVLGSDAELVLVIYGWNEVTQTWLRYVPGAPAGVNTLTTFDPGVSYWVLAAEPFTLSLPR